MRCALDRFADRRLIRTTRHLAMGLCVLLPAFGLPARATEFRAGDQVRIRGEEILDDLFAAAGNVSIETRVAGDVFAGARVVTVGDSGEIDNSLMAGAQRIDVNGTVHNSARLFAQDVTLRGHVERNLMAFSQNLLIDSRGWVEKDVNLSCAEAIIRGRVGGDIRGEVHDLVLDGQVDGDVEVNVRKLVVMPGAIIGGQLRYKHHGEEDIKIEDGAQILGGVEPIEPTDKEKKGYSIGGFLWDTWWYLGALAIGCVLLIVFRRFLFDVRDTIVASSWKSLGLGIVFLICLPIAAVAMALTLIGIPLALLTIVGWLLLLYLAKIFVGLALGEWVLARFRSGRPSPAFVAMAVGVLIVTLAAAIPYLGVLAKAIILSLAFGGFFITVQRYRARSAG